MSFSVVLPHSFKRSLKRLTKKYPRAKDDLKEALKTLMEVPTLGVPIPGGLGTRKLRVRSTDLQRGKSGGFRLIYALDHEVERIYPLLVYAKTEQSDVTRRELEQLIADLKANSENCTPLRGTVKIDHIGIVVRDIQEALKVYETALGLPLKEVVEVPDQKVEVAFLPIGESNIELVQPTTDDTGIAKYLAKRGEGIHHICVEVDDIEAALARLKAHEVQLIDEVPRQGAHGRVAFVHPKAMHGVLIELIEHDH